MRYTLDDRQAQEIDARIAAKLHEAGVNPDYLLESWTLDSEGHLQATVALLLTPEEAAALINGAREGNDDRASDSP